MVVPEVLAERLAPLSHERRVALRPLAQVAVLAATVFSGVTVALQVAILAPYPHTAGDPVMKVLAYVTCFALLATVFKAIEVACMGRWLERQLGTNRPLRFRDIRNREIRSTAIWGGLLQALYALLFIALVPVLASSTLAAAKALVIVVLPFVEMRAGIMQRHLTRCCRLFVSVLVTALGAGIVILAGGFKGLTGWSDILLFVALVVPGNIMLAISECVEYEGVHKRHTAAGIYTFARFIAYSLTCIVGMVLWGFIRQDFNVAWAVGVMCVHRWYYLVPIALLWGLTDLFRISAKPVVSASYMYVVMSGSVAIAAVTQTVARLIDPKLFYFIEPGWIYPLVCVAGGLVIVVGAKLFPHPTEVETSIVT